MTNATKTAAALALAGALAAACGPGGETRPAGRPLEAQARRQAEAIFKERCALCHGEAGNGQGKAVLGKKAQDYHDKAWQASVNDAELDKAIVEGGAAVGKSPEMPPNPDLKDRPEVVRALRELVREMGEK